MFTALLIAILIVTGAAAVVGGGLVIAAARRNELEGGEVPKQLTDGSATRTVEEVKVGDIIQTEGEDFLVEGVIAYDEDGHRWRAAKLTDGKETRWLMVGMERLGEASKRWLTVEDLDLEGFPPEVLVLGKERYKLDRRGTASATGSGDFGDLPGAKGTSPDSVLRCRWWRYEGAGEDTLIVEQWSGEYRVLRGKKLTVTDFEFMPGS
jgi:hypothetical protein